MDVSPTQLYGFGHNTTTKKPLKRPLYNFFHSDVAGNPVRIAPSPNGGKPPSSTPAGTAGSELRHLFFRPPRS